MSGEGSSSRSIVIAHNLDHVIIDGHLFGSAHKVQLRELSIRRHAHSHDGVTFVDRSRENGAVTQRRNGKVIGQQVALRLSVEEILSRHLKLGLERSVDELHDARGRVDHDDRLHLPIEPAADSAWHGLHQAACLQMQRRSDSTRHGVLEILG